MTATIIISIILALIVGLILYRLISNSRSGRGQCGGCAFSGTCAAARQLEKKAENNCSHLH
ncbi:MAG TPA: FeoB-associated Cys-rich membrane protein [Chloroflexi bacterium]|nr:FeoB-associated Cys-rich membrane protein [Chloroflexota bacterium]